jgi:Rrf2 family iron-sulfur cluster assembly transcriptional regulator
MRLTTKGRFAVTAMIDLALRCSDGPVSLAGISERQKISLSYLEQLFGKLRRHGWWKACAVRAVVIAWRGQPAR